MLLSSAPLPGVSLCSNSSLKQNGPAFSRVDSCCLKELLGGHTSKIQNPSEVLNEDGLAPLRKSLSHRHPPCCLPVPEPQQDKNYT